MRVGSLQTHIGSVHAPDLPRYTASTMPAIDLPVCDKGARSKGMCPLVMAKRRFRVEMACDVGFVSSTFYKMCLRRGKHLYPSLPTDFRGCCNVHVQRPRGPLSLDLPLTLLLISCTVCTRRRQRCVHRHHHFNVSKPFILLSQDQWKKEWRSVMPNEYK